MGTGGLGALMTAKAQGEVPVKAVMSIYTDQPDAIFAVAGSGIATIRDVAGKTVATAPFSSSNVTWPLVLAANGVDPEKVKLLKVDPGALAPMLATGQVDATINWVTVAPGSTGVLKEAGKELVVLPWSNFGFEGYGLSMFASDKMLAERPLTVGKVVKVMQQAMAMAAAEPSAAGEALKAKVPEVDAAVAAAEFAASVPLIFNAVTEKHGIGAFDKARLATIWEWVAKSQNYPMGKLDPETLVDRGFVGG
jgi:NitT/TauT family transport system substrate-binding protein